MIDCQRQDEAVPPLDEWYRSPLGIELVQQEQDCLARMLGDTFGYYLLQVGGSVGFADAIQASRIRQRILLPDKAVTQVLGAQIVGASTRLPIASDSVDAVLLPHTLEFAEDAKQVLRETERVLIPEGRLVVLGFNALSLWGARRVLRRRRRTAPWCGAFLTPYRVGDWLSVLGFDVEIQEMMMFRPPWRRALLQQRSILDSMGRRFWPVFGGVYAIRAVKRVSTMTPLRPSWNSRRPVLGSGAVEPTARGSSSRRDGPAQHRRLIDLPRSLATDAQIRQPPREKARG